MNPKAPIEVVIAGLLSGGVLIPKRPCNLVAPPASACSCDLRRENPHIEPETLRLDPPLLSGMPPIPTSGVNWAKHCIHYENGSAYANCMPR
jgi:hypothetical protein